MSSLFLLCYRSRELEWEEREAAYIKELKKANDRVDDQAQLKAEIEDRFRQEQTRWHLKEDDYIEKINELQNELHQKEVVTQQYKIYEGNFQQDRQHLQEIQGHIEDLKRKADTQEKEIVRLKAENQKYLDTIIAMGKEMALESSLDLKKSRKITNEQINGLAPHITESILV